MSEFNNGAVYARDVILSSVIGLQNEMGHHNPDNPEYKAYQKVYDLIVDKYGDMLQKFKG